MKLIAIRGNDVLRSVCLVAVTLLLLPAAVGAAVEVYPERVRLTSRRSRIQLVITSRDADGRLRDVTHRATVRSSKPGLVSVRNGRVSPSDDGVDGRATLHVEWQDETVEVPVEVSGQKQPDPIAFKYETLAAMTKQGCNAGSCHGSPDGKGGFSLSLFAFDPVHDTESLVRGGLNRRVNVFAPLESLMLKKPMLRVPHVGGKRLRPTDAAYMILKRWISEGARPDRDGAPSCEKIVVHPGPSRVLARPDATQQLSVLAHFTDGTVRDVTRLATFDTSHRDIATIDADGRVTGRSRGQAAITVRFLEHLESVYLTFIEEVEGFEWPAVAEHNFVDRLVNSRLKLLSIAPSPTCDDRVFLRRVYLDLTGLLPSAAAARTFLAEKKPGKRARLIDRLLATDQFARFQALQLADLLRVNPKVLGADRAKLFANWIAEAMVTNRPYDQLTRDLLTSTGDTRLVAEANYFAAIPKTEDVAEATAQVFMGSRIQCAKCHNHPFENWTQDDYYSIGAAFHRVARQADRISVVGGGEMVNPRSGKVMTPWGRNRVMPRPLANADRRVAFAGWLTARGNPFFARAAVNRIWDHLFGRGIVDPVDDFRSSNPPSNVELLDRLAAEFEKSGFDRRQTVRVICNSQTYQRSTITNRFNRNDTTLCSRAPVRLLTAEQLQDAIGYVTGSVKTVEQSAAVVAQSRRELERVGKELRTKRPQWEAGLVERLKKAAWWNGAWWSAGAFTAKTAEATHSKDFGPETSSGRFDASRAFGPNKIRWQPRPDWNRGQQVNLPKGAHKAMYAWHVVHARAETRVRLRVVADDGMKVWHNGQLVFDFAQVLPDDKEQQPEIVLRPGANRFLLKIVNKGGAWHFTWRLEPTQPDSISAPAVADLPDALTEVLMRPVEKRVAEPAARLDRFYLMRDGQIEKLRVRIESGARDQYATQRPFPGSDAFLKAFGQPERNTPCACERSSEPTLDQALQLLNGQRVHDQVARSVGRFSKLENGPLVAELYMSAFSRKPSTDERVAATQHLVEATDRNAAIRDLVWAVINTQEFIFQH